MLPQHLPAFIDFAKSSKPYPNNRDFYRSIYPKKKNKKQKRRKKRKKAKDTITISCLHPERTIPRDIIRNIYRSMPNGSMLNESKRHMAPLFQFHSWTTVDLPRCTLNESPELFVAQWSNISVVRACLIRTSPLVNWDSLCTMIGKHDASLSQIRRTLSYV